MEHKVPINTAFRTLLFFERFIASFASPLPILSEDSPGSFFILCKFCRNLPIIKTIPLFTGRVNKNKDMVSSCKRERSGTWKFRFRILWNHRIQESFDSDLFYYIQLLCSTDNGFIVSSLLLQKFILVWNWSSAISVSICSAQSQARCACWHV